MIGTTLPTVDYSTYITSQISSNTSQKSLQDQIKEQRAVAQLQQIDQKVRAHEMAHLSAGAGVVKGGVSYQYVKGADGRQYAVGGEVPIDVSPASTPQETVKKMDRVIAAALAPADPSPQDLKVAAKAAQMKLQAMLEMMKEQEESTISLYA